MPSAAYDPAKESVARFKAKLAAAKEADANASVKAASSADSASE